MIPRFTTLFAIIFELCFGSCCIVFAQDADELFSEDTIKRLSTVFTGDFDQMVHRRFIRVLMPYSKTFFFFDGAQPRGASYDLVQAFEKELNKKMKTGHLKIHLIILPTARERLLPNLRDGKGDLAVGNLTITEERENHVDFSDPLATDISEILVSSKGAAAVKSISELGGKTVHARKSSSYYESLVKLNTTLRSSKKPQVNIVAADDNLEDEDLLEMANAGLIDYLVVDSHKAEFWADIFDNIVLHREIKLRTNGKIAWALRKNNPKLKSVVNRFVKGHKIGTLHGNILLNRYLKDTSYITNSIYKENFKRFKLTVDFFEKYGKQYNFDYLMLAALAYQESQLDQSLRSQAGAVGVMQVLPSTAKDKNINIPNISELDPNIHAGTKYLRFMADNYFADDNGLDPLNRTLFTFASYNAGPAKVAHMRRDAAKMGFDPNKWFKNVEIVAAKQIGRETVQYVSNIFKYYVAYKFIEDKKKVEDRPN